MVTKRTHLNFLIIQKSKKIERCEVYTFFAIYGDFMGGRTEK